MAVRPDHQRRGIGRMLMADFEAQVRERGGSTVVLVPDDVDGATTAHGLDLYPEIWRAGWPTPRTDHSGPHRCHAAAG